MNIVLVGYEANVKQRVGSNQYAFELLRHLYQQDRQNQYRVLLPNPPLNDLPSPRAGWQYIVVKPARFWNYYGLPKALLRLKPKPDLIFNPGHYCPLLINAPLVISIMDLGFLRNPLQFNRRTYLKLKYWTYWSACRAKHIFTISETSKQDIIRNYRLDPTNITVTYPGYDQKIFHPQITAERINRVRQQYGLPLKYILFLSTLKPSKNIEGLLKAFKIFVANNSEYTLVIAGKKGWMYTGIFELVRQLQLENRVIFTDFVPEADVPPLIKGAAIFVLPSFWEGFGIPVIEAMACGTPVVASNIGSLSEVIGRAGILIDPVNPQSITNGLSQALVRSQRLRLLGLARVTGFSWTKCAKITLQQLNQINL